MAPKKTPKRERDETSGDTKQEPGDEQDAKRIKTNHSVVVNKANESLKRMLEAKKIDDVKKEEIKETQKMFKDISDTAEKANFAAKIQQSLKNKDFTWTRTWKETVKAMKSTNEGSIFNYYTRRPFSFKASSFSRPQPTTTGETKLSYERRKFPGKR